MDERQKAHPLVFTLVKIQRKYNKDYSWPSQKKIIELMDLRQLIKKCRATINRWLRVAEDGNYLIRRRRIKRDPIHGMIFKSQLWDVMQIFGKHLYNGCTVPFAKNEITISSRNG